MQTFVKSPHTGGCVHSVEPALGRLELRWVMLAAAATLVLAALAVAWQRHHQHAVELAAYQLDLATGLQAAEQGIYTDLQAVYDEWTATGATLPAPAPEVWAEDGWPPFADAHSNTARTARSWALAERAGRWAYVGELPGQRPVAWVLPAPGDAQPRFDVWLGPDATASLPARLEPQALAAASWRQVVAHTRDAAGDADDVNPHAGHKH